MPPRLTDEDQINVKLYILLPMVITVFERDKQIAAKAFKTPDPYLALIDKAIRTAEMDAREVRRKLRALGIKIYEERRTEDGLQSRYLCRGYHHEFGMLWPLIKAESRILMDKYLGLDTSQYINPAVPIGNDDFDRLGH